MLGSESGELFKSTVQDQSAAVSAIHPVFIFTLFPLSAAETPNVFPPGDPSYS